MGQLDVKLHKLKTRCNHGYWQDRVYSELKIAIQMSKIRGGRYDSLILGAEDRLLGGFREEKTVSPEAAREAEAMLLPLSDDVKSFTLHCVSHAHIDMNWMWRFDETVAITLDTFRTMLDLLAEYPQFTFSQSQASVYKIVEEYGPAGMLDEIRKYVKEGRWEVAASTWVEADKNMPNGESMARHLLYTRRYLTRLLGLPEGALRLDYEPDTFGHSINVPTILADAGVEYYYHCRGSRDPMLTWWQAPSGKRVLAYRDSNWYNCAVNADFATGALPACGELGVDAMLKVYGVGDHGGGPSRRDIERILDMQGWPIYPTLTFSTYHAFFDHIKEKFSDKLPVSTAEMNPIFTGCYTTQTRIKLANRVGEAVLHEAEMFGALAASKAGFAYDPARLEKAWENVLFSQFHDILTGSGVADTREYAMGKFQESAAAANTEKLGALRALAARIDTSRFESGEALPEPRVEGAGVGRGIVDFRISQVHRGDGARVFHVFNAAACARTGLAEITVWDIEDAALPLMEFCDEDGKIVPHQQLKDGCEPYFGHRFASVLLPVSVPAAGWATYTLRESETALIPPTAHAPADWLIVEPPHEYVLENDLVRVCLDTRQGVITSYYDKENGREWLKEGAHGGFRLIDEDPDRGMTSWIIGRHMNIRDFESVKIKPVFTSGETLRQSVSIEAKWSRSTLTAVLSLDRGSRMLLVKATCDWHEKGARGDQIPQLSFAVPLAGEIREYGYDVPFGTIVRGACDLDLPGNSYIAALPAGGADAFMLSADSKYGYRGFDDGVAVTLIRASFDPDPSPEYGVHKIQLAVGPAGREPGSLVRRAFELWHPFNTLAASAHAGDLPTTGSLLGLESDGIVLQAVKLAEDGGAAVIRLYDADGRGGKAALKLPAFAGKTAEVTDVHERPTGKTLDVRDGVLVADVAPASVVHLKIALR